MTVNFSPTLEYNNMHFNELRGDLPLQGMIESPLSFDSLVLLLKQVFFLLFDLFLPCSLLGVMSFSWLLVSQPLAAFSS